MLLGVALKPVPTIVTVDPAAPLAGVKLVIVGGNTVKVVLEQPFEPFTETHRGPVVAAKGKLTTS